MKISTTNKRPKIACVSFNTVVSLDKSLTNISDIEKLWKDPPRANAIDVAQILQKLGCDVTVTGFIPKRCAKETFERLGLHTDFIEIDNHQLPNSDNSSDDLPHTLTVTDEEKAQLIELLIGLDKQMHAIIFTGTLPTNFTLQDFKVLSSKRLKNLKFRTFSDISDKITEITHTYLTFSTRPFERYALSHQLYWQKGDAFELIYNYKKETVTLHSFTKYSPQYVRSALFAGAIFAQASDSMHYQIFSEQIKGIYRDMFNKYKDAKNAEHQEKVLDESTLKLLNVTPDYENMTLNQIANLMSYLMIHTVSSGSLTIPCRADIERYDAYFSIASSEIDTSNLKY